MLRWPVDCLSCSQVEKALYGGNSGAMNKLLCRASLQRCPLALSKASVPSLVTDAELSSIRSILEASLDLDARGRVRSVTLLARSNAVAAAQYLGRSERTIAFLRCFSQPLPRMWELQAEQEQLEEDEVDLVLESEIEDELELEMPLHAELLYTHVQSEVTQDEQEAVKRWKLERIPPALEKQLESYRDWRLQPLNFQRAGNAIVDVTAASDRGTALRFIAYCHAEHGVAPSLDVFGSGHLADLTQKWLEALVERGLMWSTLANYVNSLCSVAAYVWDACEVSEEAIQMNPQPPDALLRLRSQCENQQKQARPLHPIHSCAPDRLCLPCLQQKLYARKPSNWLDWEVAQQARVKCAHVWATSSSLSHSARVALLKEYLVLLFHTVMPPDRCAPASNTSAFLVRGKERCVYRVGIVRRLRWGYTLKEDAKGAYKLDMTEVCHVTKALRSIPLTGCVSRRLASRTRVSTDQVRRSERGRGDTQYVLHARMHCTCRRHLDFLAHRAAPRLVHQTDRIRHGLQAVRVLRQRSTALPNQLAVECVLQGSFQEVERGRVRDTPSLNVYFLCVCAFALHRCPPKMLRASFVCWIRANTEAPEILKSAVRHKY